jgi:hypothetical protein
VLTVTVLGAPTELGPLVGSLELTAGGLGATVFLGAVVGSTGLPELLWTPVEGGLEAIGSFPTAPFPEGDASVWLFVPDGMSTTGGLHSITHLHGHHAELARTVPAQQLVPMTRHAGRDAVLVIPQGPLNQASGDFGQLMDPDGHAELVRDVAAVLHRDGLLVDARTGPGVLTAHSGGYRATAAMASEGGLDIQAVHLFDALYGEEDAFEDYAQGPGVFRSAYTVSGGTTEGNTRVRNALEAAGVAVGSSLVDADLAADRVTIAASGSTHEGVLTDRLGFARWLVHSGLPPHPWAPPEWRAAVAVGGDVAVSWRPDLGAPDRLVAVEASDDGVTWEERVKTAAAEAVVAPAPWLRLVAVDLGTRAAPSDTYGATGSSWLVVHGFERVLGGSWTEPTDDFAARLGGALGRSFSTAHHEEVATGALRLEEFGHVLWLLGDESLADETFDARERDAVAAYLDSGGNLLVTGSEVGFASDGDWLYDVLHTEQVADDAGASSVEGWPFGTVYEEDYPDVLSGQTELWTYDAGGSAAVGWESRVVVVGFGLETMEDSVLAEALPDLVAYLEP